MEKKLISIVVPCYNEEEAIPLYYEAMAKQMAKMDYVLFEIIFVNDGSKDKSLAIMRDLAKKDKRVRYVSFSRNFGKEAAMLAGLSYASGDCAVIMDADLQHPPELIPQMVDGYLEGYDQVIGRRNRQGDSKRKTLSAHLYYKMINSIVDVKMVDGMGDFRLLSRKAIDAILAMKEYNRFSKGLFSWIGFKQKVIDYENQPRAGGESKWSMKRLMSYGIDGLISFNHKPLRICCVFGGILVVVSLIYILITFIQILIHGIDVPGYFTTICAIMIIGGVQLISTGVLGEYIGRIYYEVKRRPAFLVQETDLEGKNNDRED